MENKKVLMVDREKVVLTTAKKLLARENYDLVLCSEVDEALDIISEKGPFAVVVSDNQLSAMRGTEFLTKLKSLAPDTVRILMAVVRTTFSRSTIRTFLFAIFNTSMNIKWKK